MKTRYQIIGNEVYDTQTDLTWFDIQDFTFASAYDSTVTYYYLAGNEYAFLKVDLETGKVIQTPFLRRSPYDSVADIIEKSALSQSWTKIRTVRGGCVNVAKV